MLRPFRPEIPGHPLHVIRRGRGTRAASAARGLGLIDAQTANVRMQSGVAPSRFDERNESPERVTLFGVTQQANSPV